jgi:hypothetical protein
LLHSPAQLPVQLVHPLQESLHPPVQVSLHPAATLRVKPDRLNPRIPMVGITSFPAVRKKFRLSILSSPGKTGSFIFSGFLFSIVFF